jgi:hypothetical protein
MTGLRRALWAIAGAGGLILAIQIVLIGSAEFAPDRGLWIALDIVAGGGFVGVGLFAWWRRPDNRVGALMVATGFTWFPRSSSCSASRRGGSNRVSIAS